MFQYLRKFIPTFLDKIFSELDEKRLSAIRLRTYFFQTSIPLNASLLLLANDQNAQNQSISRSKPLQLRSSIYMQFDTLETEHGVRTSQPNSLHLAQCN